MGAIFAENLSIFENSGFDFGNGYFDDYYGQTLFLDCILMDIMIYKAIPDGGVAPHHWLRFRLSHMI